MLDMLIGKTILNDFTIIRKVGAGAFATVYLAKQENMDRLVVAKITHPHLVEGTMASMVQARFQDEVRASSRVKHQNLVTIYTAGQVMGCPTLVMEYVEGVPLESWLNDHNNLSTEMMAPLFMQIASALDSLHKAGIVHRDLSPRNIMMAPTPDGGHKAVLLDFGIAQLDGNTKYTLGPLGTPRYMSPEQAQGISSPASDMYSFGAMLWWALTGKQHLEHLNSFTDIFKFQLKQKEGLDPRSIAPHIPAELAHMVSRLLASEPSNRPSASEFISFWVNYHERQAPQQRSVLAKTDQYQSIKSMKTISSLDAVSSFATEIRSVFLLNTGEAHQLVKETKDALSHLINCVEIDSLWDLQASPQLEPEHLLLCVQHPQTALMTVNMFRDLPIAPHYKLSFIAPQTTWTQQLEEISELRVFVLPGDAIALQKHLAVMSSIPPETGQYLSIPHDTGAFSSLNQRLSTLNNSTSVVVETEETIDWVLVRQNHNASPSQTASYIDAFIGRMPNILAELEGNLSNPTKIVSCCHEIDRMAKPLGMKHIMRLSKMLSGFAEHNLIDDLNGPYDELEDAYAQGFQELMAFQQRHIQTTQG